MYQLEPATTINRRTPPVAIESEEEILGGILLDPNAITRVIDIVTPESFYSSVHQEIYRVMRSLYLEEKGIDMVTVVTRLNDLGLLAKVGGQGTIATLYETCVSSVNIDQHAALVAEKHKRRQLIQLCQQAAGSAYDSNIPWNQTLSEVQEQIYALSESSQRKGLRDLSDILAEEFTRLQSIAEGDEPQFYKTGFYDLDNLLQGLKPQQLIIAAGRPSMGKSAFAGAIARNIAAQGLPVAVFSLEMSDEEVARRLWSSDSSVHGQRLESGKLDESEWGELASSLCDLAGLPVSIDESTSIDISYVQTECMRLKAKKGQLGLVIIDYLHLLVEGDDEQKELGKITRACKRMSRSLDAPVLLLSQLNRGVESRNNKRPMMSDLRQSGAIEQDADVILLLYRDEYYNPDTPDRGIAEVIIAKQRNGPVGVARLLFEPQFSRFKNLARRG